MISFIFVLFLLVVFSLLFSYFVSLELVRLFYFQNHPSIIYSLCLHRFFIPNIFIFLLSTCLNLIFFLFFFNPSTSYYVFYCNF